MTRPGPKLALSPATDAYCVARATGSTQLTAWRQSHPESKATDENAGRLARRLEARAEVRKRIAELVGAAKRKAEDAIQSAGADIARGIVATRQWVIDQLVENVRVAKAAVPVLDTKGEPTGAYRTNIGAANRALELLGREIGMFREVEPKGHDLLDDLSDDEVRRLKATIDDLLANGSGRDRGTEH